MEVDESNAKSKAAAPFSGELQAQLPLRLMASPALTHQITSHCWGEIRPLGKRPKQQKQTIDKGADEEASSPSKPLSARLFHFKAKMKNNIGAMEISVLCENAVSAE